IRLDAFVGQPLVVYFYPRDNTPGCTKEGEAFRDHHDAFAELGCRIVGVSRDSLASHEKFAQKYGFPFPLIADTDESLCRHFDVIKEKNMYGKKVLGVERSTFLFDADGRLVREWRKVRVPGHVEEVLEAVRALD
ncbi:MAG: redoxin domain-containing protein, partial [Gammaproteobacteria bacterium]|nr:redoxin domain-containing protein [Gammaproteobacteria bacterium]